MEPWNWVNRPLDDHELVFGLAVFWWKRILDVVQFFAGAISLAELVQWRKLVEIRWWASSKIPQETYFPSPENMKFKEIIDGTIFAVMFLGFLWAVFGGFILFVRFLEPKVPTWALVLFSMLPILFTLLIFGIGIYETIRYIRHGVVYDINRLIVLICDPERFAKRVLVASFSIFALTSVFKLVIS